MEMIGLDPEELRSAANKADAASEQAAGIPLGLGPEQIAEALPGSASATAAGELGGGWDTEIRGLARAYDEYAQALRESARRYEADDSTSAGNFARIELDSFGGLRWAACSEWWWTRSSPL